jgi:phage portal protein BeeE
LQVVIHGFVSQSARVPLGIFSSGGKDSVSSIPLTQEEKDDAQEQLQNYGMTKLAKQFILTSASLNYQQISLPVKDLMLLEGIEANARHICNQFGFPFELMSYSSNASLSNGGEIKEAEKRHYTNQIIPDAKTLCETITNYFGMTKYTLQVYFDHLEIFQKSKEETGRALLALSAGLDRVYMKRAITLEEYRKQVANILDINPDEYEGTTYYTEPNANTGANQSAEGSQGSVN